MVAPSLLLAQGCVAPLVVVACAGCVATLCRACAGALGRVVVVARAGVCVATLSSHEAVWPRALPRRRSSRRLCPCRRHLCGDGGSCA